MLHVSNLLSALTQEKVKGHSVLLDRLSFLQGCAVHAMIVCEKKQTFKVWCSFLTKHLLEALKMVMSCLRLWKNSLLLHY